MSAGKNNLLHHTSNIGGADMKMRISAKTLAMLAGVWSMFPFTLGVSPCAAQTLPREVRSIVSQLNEEKLAYNEELLVLGKQGAKVTAVLFFGALCIESEAFFRDVLPDLRKDYIDTGKLRLVLYEYPLNWKDMQAFAGLRCLAKDKYLDALLRSADARRGNTLRRSSLDSVPAHYDSALTPFGLTREQAVQCMRNVELLSFVEGQRRLAVEQWDIMTTPTLLIGEQKFTDVATKRKFYDVMKQLVD